VHRVSDHSARRGLGTTRASPEPLPLLHQRQGVRSMRSLRPLALVWTLALCSDSFIAAYAGEGAVDRSLLYLVQERPFGGPPPPQRRSLERKARGTICKTPAITCKLQNAQPVGGACSCSGGDGQAVPGVVVEHSS
jgi:hypothetical protein